jgi:hypothetical protein
MLLLVLSQGLRALGLAVCVADALRHYRAYRQTGAPAALAHMRLALVGTGVVLACHILVWWVYS